MEALFLLVSKFVVSPQGDVQETREVLFRKLSCDPANARTFVLRDLQQRGIVSRDFGDHGIAQESDQLPDEMCWALAFSDQLIDELKNVMA